MKKDNKKALYESIMASVAKEVKKVLNESYGKFDTENNIIKEISNFLNTEVYNLIDNNFKPKRDELGYRPHGWNANGNREGDYFKLNGWDLLKDMSFIEIFNKSDDYEKHLLLNSLNGMSEKKFINYYLKNQNEIDTKLLEIANANRANYVRVFKYLVFSLCEYLYNNRKTNLIKLMHENKDLNLFKSLISNKSIYKSINRYKSFRHANINLLKEINNIISDIESYKDLIFGNGNFTSLMWYPYRDYVLAEEERKNKHNEIYSDDYEDEGEYITYNDIIDAVEGRDYQEIIDTKGEYVADYVFDNIMYPENGEYVASACVEIAERLLNGEDPEDIREELGDEKI